MKIIIRETGKIEELDLIDLDTGVSYILGRIGDTGDFNGGRFGYDKDQDAYTCTQETFEWWKKVVSDEQKLNLRIKELEGESGQEAVYNVVYRVIANLDDCEELEHYASLVNHELDNEFGKQN